MPCLAICNLALSGAIISVHLCPFYKDLVVLLKFSFYRSKPLFFFELRCRLRHPVVMRMASLMLHTCLLIPPYPVFEIEIKISLI